MIMELISLAKDALQTVAETAASYKPGQSVLRNIDRTLWVIEKCAKWAVPPPLDQDDRPQPELIRPLPWVFFLMMLVTLRVVRESISLANLVMGKPPLRSADMVMYIQSKRRYLRTLKYQGNRISRARTTPAPPQASWYSSVRALFEVTMCFRRQPMSSNNNTDDKASDTERLVVKRSKRGREDSSPVVSAGETTMERLIEKMMVDLDADSDDDSSFTLTNVTSPKSDRSDFTVESDQETAFQNNTVREDSPAKQDPSNNKTKNEQVTNIPLDNKKTAKEDVKTNNDQQRETKEKTVNNKKNTNHPEDTKTAETQNVSTKKETTKNDSKTQEKVTAEAALEKQTSKDTKVVDKDSATSKTVDTPKVNEVSQKSEKDSKSKEEPETQNTNALKDTQGKELSKTNNISKTNEKATAKESPDKQNINTSDTTEVSPRKATKAKDPKHKTDTATKENVANEEKTAAATTNSSKHEKPQNKSEEKPHSETQLKDSKVTSQNKITEVTTIETEVQELITIRNETQKSKKDLSKRTKKALSTPEITAEHSQTPLESHAVNNEIPKEVFHAPELSPIGLAKEETLKFLQQETSSKIPRNTVNDAKLANGRTVKNSPGKKRGKDSRNAGRSSSTNDM